jgi:hypothetical protein
VIIPVDAARPSGRLGGAEGNKVHNRISSLSQAGFKECQHCFRFACAWAATSGRVIRVPPLWCIAVAGDITATAKMAHRARPLLSGISATCDLRCTDEPETQILFRVYAGRCCVLLLCLGVLDWGLFLCDAAFRSPQPSRLRCRNLLVLSCLIRASCWANAPRWGGRLRCWLAAPLPLPQTSWTCCAVQIVTRVPLSLYLGPRLVNVVSLRKRPTATRAATPTIPLPTATRATALASAVPL